MDGVKLVRLDDMARCIGEPDRVIPVRFDHQARRMEEYTKALRKRGVEVGGVSLPCQPSTHAADVAAEISVAMPDVQYKNRRTSIGVEASSADDAVSRAQGLADWFTSRPVRPVRKRGQVSRGT